MLRKAARNGEVRKYLYSSWTGPASIIPSQPTFIMIDLRREVRPIIMAMRERKVGLVASFQHCQTSCALLSVPGRRWKPCFGLS